jgi:hypothetical protein
MPPVPGRIGPSRPARANRSIDVVASGSYFFSKYHDLRWLAFVRALLFSFLLPQSKSAAYL